MAVETVDTVRLARMLAELARLLLRFSGEGAETVAGAVRAAGRQYDAEAEVVVLADGATLTVRGTRHRLPLAQAERRLRRSSRNPRPTRRGPSPSASSWSSSELMAGGITPGAARLVYAFVLLLQLYAGTLIGVAATGTSTPAFWAPPRRRTCRAGSSPAPG